MYVENCSKKFFLVLWNVLANEGVLPIFYVGRKLSQKFKTLIPLQDTKMIRNKIGVSENLAT